MSACDKPPSTQKITILEDKIAYIEERLHQQERKYFDLAFRVGDNYWDFVERISNLQDKTAEMDLSDPTDPRFAAEGTFKLLREKFIWAWQDIPLQERVTNPANARYPARASTAGLSGERESYPVSLCLLKELATISQRSSPLQSIKPARQTQESLGNESCLNATSRPRVP